MRLSETTRDTTHVYDYHYDAAGRLDSVATDVVMTQGLTYDLNGNRVAARGLNPVDTTYYDDQDRLLCYGDHHYAYAPNGELLADTLGSAVTRYTYDQLGNLLKVRLANGDSIEYLVDGQNRRVARKVNGTLMRKWLYDGPLHPAAELEPNGNLVNRYIYGTREHAPDLVLRPDSGYRVVTDHLGSVRALVDTLNGGVRQRVDYDAWGNPMNAPVPAFEVLGFAGGIYDSLTGLARFGSRDYDASRGRWTRKDRELFGSGSVNLYSYCDAMPLDYIDPMGDAKVRNKTREPVIVTGGSGSGLGHGGQQVYGVIPPDGIVYGGSERPVHGYGSLKEAQRAAALMKEGKACPAGDPKHPLEDIDAYYDKNGRQTQIHGDAEGPTYDLRDGPNGSIRWSPADLGDFVKGMIRSGWEKVTEKR